ncbi:MAG: aldo/keto reductase [Chloroflexota bacterium]|nr:MAG: aldo/keto reductase [Chloroflexota bacterium]
MEKIRLGKTDMLVSRLGFGGIPIQRLSEDDAVAVVKRCLDLGITFLDTANGYTTSEERIGKAIAGRREEVVIATKSLSRKREGTEKHLNLSLERLNVKYIDLYQFHGISDEASLDMILAPDGPLAFAEKARDKGLIKHIGITSHQIDVAKEAVASDHFETIMFPFNFVTSEAADELIPLARKHDVGFIAMKPLAGGMIDNARIAFKYLFQFPDIVTIPGIERVSEIEEIVRVLADSKTVTAAEKKEMQKLKDELGTRFCHRCDYCQPCDEGIMISNVMAYPGLRRRIPPERLFGGPWGQMVEKAATCTECGECEEKCPYDLPIRELLAEYVKEYRKDLRRYQKTQPPA